MPSDNAHPGSGSRPGSGSGPDSASGLAFEQTLRGLLDQATRSVTAPADLTARICTSPPPRWRGRGRCRALVLTAAALATSSVIIGGLAVDRNLASDNGVNVIAPAVGSSLPTRPATGVTAHSSVSPTGRALAPPVAGAKPDQATADEITTAFTEAFDADNNVDDGLAYVQNGERYRDITQRFVERYPGVVGTLRVRLENITLIAGDQATATIIITHADPKLGAQWGYEIRRTAQAVRVNGRWLVSASTYSFLVGTS
ncbi:hypothetical protein ND748_05120 [Frankia sp. AiPs1]|uniref:hypothetical protein n=1 Tax=Frankia sp. AiPs1 TaxID=573493 RepID=UPI002042EC50|nr:hypothetical protein [Frankia sp. AiPs1]MCM3921059.1 hypothetical protein [Frankia sp. AiPs1]